MPVLTEPTENQVYLSVTKGQLISKCPCGVLKSSKKPANIFPGFLS